jgi:hypothetical protein
MIIEDVSGKKPALAVEIFGLSIQALVNHLMDLLKSQGTGVKIDEIQWVLTIPAIWTDILFCLLILEELLTIIV